MSLRAMVDLLEGGTDGKDVVVHSYMISAGYDALSDREQLCLEAVMALAIYESMIAAGKLRPLQSWCVMRINAPDGPIQFNRSTVTSLVNMRNNFINKIPVSVLQSRTEQLIIYLAYSSQHQYGELCDIELLGYFLKALDRSKNHGA
jgi:hypothetical protein